MWMRSDFQEFSPVCPITPAAIQLSLCRTLSGTAGSPGNNPTTSDIPMWEYADSISTIHGRHTFSMGFDFRTWVQKRDLSTNFLGSFTFNNTTVSQNGNNGTNNCATAYCGTGNATADFLLGYYGGASTFQPGPFSQTGAQLGNLNQYHFKYIGPSFQDDWKATPDLTLNLGARWDFRTIPYETQNKMFWIDDQNTGGGLCFAQKALLTDGIAPAGNGFYRYCGRNNPRDPSYLTFAPRLGFATVLSMTTRRSFVAAMEPSSIPPRPAKLTTQATCILS